MSKTSMSSDTSFTSFSESKEEDQGKKIRRTSQPERPPNTAEASSVAHNRTRQSIEQSKNTASRKSADESKAKSKQKEVTQSDNRSPDAREKEVKQRDDTQFGRREVVKFSGTEHSKEISTPSNLTQFDATHTGATQSTRKQDDNFTDATIQILKSLSVTPKFKAIQPEATQSVRKSGNITTDIQMSTTSQPQTEQVLVTSGVDGRTPHESSGRTSKSSYRQSKVLREMRPLDSMSSTKNLPAHSEHSVIMTKKSIDEHKLEDTSEMKRKRSDEEMPESSTSSEDTISDPDKDIKDVRCCKKMSLRAGSVLTTVLCLVAALVFVWMAVIFFNGSEPLRSRPYGFLLIIAGILDAFICTAALTGTLIRRGTLMWPFVHTRPIFLLMWFMLAVFFLASFTTLGIGLMLGIVWVVFLFGVYMSFGAFTAYLRHVSGIKGNFLVVKKMEIACRLLSMMEVGTWS